MEREKMQMKDEKSMAALGTDKLLAEQVVARIIYTACQCHGVQICQDNDFHSNP
jgi:hypothetical protein